MPIICKMTFENGKYFVRIEDHGCKRLFIITYIIFLVPTKLIGNKYMKMICWKSDFSRNSMWTFKKIDYKLQTIWIIGIKKQITQSSLNVNKKIIQIYFCMLLSAFFNNVRNSITISSFWRLLFRKWLSIRFYIKRTLSLKETYLP